MKTVLIVLIAYLFILIFGCTKSQTSCGFKQTPVGERISWKTSSPIPFYLHNSVPAQYKLAIHKAANTWNSAAGHMVIYLDDSPDQDINLKTNTIFFNTIIKRDPIEHAYTSSYWYNDLVKIAFIGINPAKHYYADSSPDPAGVNIEALMLHEFGHALGLMHSDDPSSVMYPYLNYHEDKITLSHQDIENIKCEY